jgi:tyrosinase
MTVAAPTPTRAPVHLRHRRSARRLSKGQLADLREAVTLAQKIGDDRGYQYWAGIHGLPLPVYCQHGSPIFLPWHRAYLYFFEKALQDRVPAPPWLGGTGPTTTAKGCPRATPGSAPRSGAKTRSRPRRSSPVAGATHARNAPGASPATRTGYQPPNR